VLKELNDKSKTYPIQTAISELSEEILPKVEAFISQSVMTITEILWADGSHSNSHGSAHNSTNSVEASIAMSERPMSILIGTRHAHPLILS